MNKEMDRDILISVARTALRTKLAQSVADHLAEVGHNSGHLPVITSTPTCGGPLSYPRTPVLWWGQCQLYY